MKQLMAFTMAFGLTVSSGCAGFTAGVKHAATGTPPTAEEKAKPGYDWGVLVMNAVIALTGYAARHYQDKLKVKIPDKGDPQE